LLRTRQLARVRIGSRVLISTAELNRFIEARTEFIGDESSTNYENSAWRKPRVLVDRTGE
jgi:hypothetical protein